MLKSYYEKNKDKIAAQQKIYQQKNKDKITARRKKWEKLNADAHRKAVRKKELKKYGLTEKTFNALLDSQNGACAICLRPCDVRQVLCVDHCHKTNKVRGLLCHKCNIGLGAFKDDPWNLIRAAQYLDESVI